MKRPLFSVVIPTHNRPNLLKRAILSVQQQIEFASECEIIVVSDCVNKETDALCSEMLGSRDIFLRRSGTPGPAISRNLGIQLSRGSNILFLDDDDAWNDEFLKALSQCEQLSHGFPVYFDCVVVKEERAQGKSIKINEFEINNNNRLTQDVFVKNQISNSALAYPRDLISQILFDSNLKAYEDWDFLLSVCEKKFPVYVPVMGPRIHEVDNADSDRRGQSQHANNLSAVIDYLYIYRKHPTNEELRVKRSQLLKSAAIDFPDYCL